MFQQYFTSTLVLSGILLLVLVNGTPVQNARQKQQSSDDSWMHPSDNNNNPFSERKRSAKLVEDSTFWGTSAQEKLANLLENRNIEAEAKNLILFLGDGMSLPTVTAARIYKGQLENLEFGGEEAELHFENFPHIALSKTFCSDRQVADSACSATAYLGGTKANYKTIGVTPDVKVEDCVGQMKEINHVSSILKWAQDAGKSTGVVTTTRITHASPAGTYAHIAHRDWENDGKIKQSGVDPTNCDDIAKQLIMNEPGRKINVILGGGRRQFVPANVLDIESDEPGYRTDGQDLLEAWRTDKKIMNQNDPSIHYQYLTNRSELESLNVLNMNYVLGLFSPDHLGYVDELDELEDPTLVEMVEKAIEILSQNPKGFFLFVEGGKIDHAHHDNWAKRAMVETLEFDKAITYADAKTEDKDTLIVVTADHAHVMTISGYPSRGNPLFHAVDTELDDQGLEYGTISYANGPGYRDPEKNASGECMKYNITQDAAQFDDVHYRQIANSLLGSETHGGDDVGIFAKGPFAHLFTGALHQNVIPHIMAYAGCVGDGRTFCNTDAPGSSSSNYQLSASQNFLLYMLLVLPYFGFNSWFNP